jgi:hypothetical protein
MASWKKVLTDGDNTNIANTNLTADAVRTLTLANSATAAAADSSFSLKAGGGGVLMQANTIAGLNYAVSFTAAFYEVNAILSLSGQSTVGGRIALYKPGTGGYTNTSGASYIGIQGPTNTVTSRFYKLPETKPTNDGEFWLGDSTSSGSPPVNDTYWSTGLEYDSTNKELKLNASLAVPQGVASDRSGTLLDVTEVDDAAGKCIGDFVNLDGLSSATFATNKVFAFSGAGAPLADADNESDATRMLLFNNIAQSSSTTLKALRKGMAIIPDSEVEGTAAAGAIMYLHPSGGTSADEGKMTFDRPTASGKFVRHVGYCIKTVTISSTDYVVFLFDPSSDFIKLA